MNTIDKVQAAVDEIREVCRKHGIVLVGTCEVEGICGEITIGWSTQLMFLDKSAKESVDNLLLGSDYDGFVIGGIGYVVDPIHAQE